MNSISLFTNLHKQKGLQQSSHYIYPLLMQTYFNDTKCGNLVHDAFFKKALR